MRAFRNTTLSCGLLSCPVKIYSATEDEREIKFNLVGPNGEAAEQIYVEAEPAFDQVMYAGRKEEYFGRRVVKQFDRDRMGKSWHGSLINKDELTQAERDNTTDENGNDLGEIMIDKFIPLKDIPWERGKKLYFIGPDKSVSGRAFETFKEAMKRRRVAAVAKVVVKKRQMLLVMFVRDGALLAFSIRFASEMRERSEDVEDDLTDNRVELRTPEIRKMGELIEEYKADASVIDELKEDYIDRKVEIVEAILAGKDLPKREKSKVTSKEPDLMAELEASIVDAKKPRSKKAKAN